MAIASDIKQEYTITIFSENTVGLLSRVVGVFTKRHINIESIVASESSMKGIYKYTIVVCVDEILVRKLISQLDKQVDVLKAFHYRRDEIVYQEIALYKVVAEKFKEGSSIEQLIRKHNARLLSVEPEFFVLEKTGHKEETEALLNDLKAEGAVFEFVRSGRVAIIKPMERLNTYLESLKDITVSMD